ncbi:MAG: GGDEF domain-containing protein, partial [Pseudomonadales bacterium]
LALHGVVAVPALVGWCFAVILVSLLRVLLTRLLLRHINSHQPLNSLSSLNDKSVNHWSLLLLGMTFLQASCWGAAALVIWPEDLGQRAFLVAVLAGIIAAGGITLALHRLSFWFYCPPVALPAMVQLALAGSRLELALAALLLVYAVLLLLGVNRLTNVFREALRLRLHMQNESRTDALTGLANRRGFDEALQGAWQQAIRSAQPVGLLLMDLDYFKEYNDRYGHPKGDEALQAFSELLRQTASRSTDFCARIGGEEFAVLMPATGLDGSKQVAGDIRQALHLARIGASERKGLTVSIGVNVCQPTRGSSLAEFVEQTDRALYEAKRQGRDAVVALPTG